MNFYWRTRLDRLHPIVTPTGDQIELAEVFDRSDPRIHIGKRNGAGRYCWACRQTLCPGGEEEVHQSAWAWDGDPWPEECPVCGKRPVISKTFGREAFTTACSFTWAQDPARVRHVCERNPFAPIIVDESGGEMECSDFLKMLKQTCPIEFTNSIGVPFS